MAKQPTIEVVVPGLSVETGGDGYEDAMASLQRVRIVIPPMGLSEEELDNIIEAMATLGDGSHITLDGLRAFLASAPEDKADVPPLSKEAYIQRARLGVASLDECLSHFSPPLMTMINSALNLAFRLGGLSSELLLRERHLEDVTREKKAKEDRLSGGRARAGKFAAGSLELVEFMREKVAKGMSIRRAAFIANRKGLGTSVAANQKKYSDWKKKGRVAV